MQSRSHIWRVLGFSSLVLLLGALLFGLSSRPGAATSAPDSPIEYVSSMGGSVTSIAVNGDIAYVGQGGTFATFDISDPGKISRLDNIPLPDFALQIQVVDWLAYVADGQGGLQIIDVRDPYDLTGLGTYSTTGMIRDVEVIGNLAYLVDSSTMRIVDIANPTSPVLIGSYTLPGGSCYGIQVIGSLAYVAGVSGLDILNVSNPSQPEFVGHYTTIFGNAKDVRVTGSLAIIIVSGDSINFEDEVLVIDIREPSSPILVGSYANDNHSLNSIPHVQIMGHLAFIAWDGWYVDVIDFTVPTSPTLLARYEYTAINLQITDSRAYLASVRDGFQILDISDPADPISLGSHDVFGFLYDVHVQPPYLYTTDTHEKLNILNVTSPADPVLLTGESASSRRHGPGYNLKVIGNLAYLNRFNYGFEIFDVLVPTNPLLLSGYQPASHGSYTAKAVSGSYAYIGELGAGINILDVSDPRMPVYVTTVSVQPYLWPEGIKALNNHLYVADRQGGLFILDISDPSQSHVVGSYTASYASGVDVKGTLAYIVCDKWNDKGLYILDVSNPATPVIVGHYATSYTALSEILVVNNLAFIADSYNGLLVIDVTDPTNPSLFARYDIPGGVHGVDVSGNTIYIAAQTGGLWILRLSNWDPPIELPAETPSPQDMVELRNWFFIPFLQKK